MKRLMAIGAVSRARYFFSAGVEGIDTEGVAIALLPPSGRAELSFTARIERPPSLL